MKWIFNTLTVAMMWMAQSASAQSDVISIPTQACMLACGYFYSQYQNNTEAEYKKDVGVIESGIRSKYPELAGDQEVVDAILKKDPAFQNLEARRVAETKKAKDQYLECLSDCFNPCQAQCKKDRHAAIDEAIATLREAEQTADSDYSNGRSTSIDREAQKAAARDTHSLAIAHAEDNFIECNLACEGANSQHISAADSSRQSVADGTANELAIDGQTDAYVSIPSSGTPTADSDDVIAEAGTNETVEQLFANVTDTPVAEPAM
jgi:hypothetical protein